jgi:hypothetical protein
LGIVAAVGVAVPVHACVKWYVEDGLVDVCMSVGVDMEALTMGSEWRKIEEERGCGECKKWRGNKRRLLLQGCQ